MTRGARRWVAGLTLMPLGLAAVIGVEVQRARIGSRSDPGPVLDLDAVAPGPMVVWLGDSTAAGVGVTRAADALPRQVADRSGAGGSLVSLAVSGARAADVLHRQVPAVPPAATAVIVDVGANDVVHGGSLSSFRRQYSEILRRLPRGATVIMLGVPDMGSPPRLDQPLRALAGWRGRQFDAAVAGVARKAGAHYVDIAGATGPAFRSHPRQYFSADRYHPDVAGYRLWAEAVAPVLAAALAPLGRSAAGPPRA